MMIVRKIAFPFRILRFSRYFHGKGIRNPFTFEEVQVLRETFSTIENVQEFSDYYYQQLIKRNPDIVSFIGNDHSVQVHKISLLISNAVYNSHNMSMSTLLNLAKSTAK